MVFIGAPGGGAPPKVWGGAAGCGADGSGQGCWQGRQLQGFWLRGTADAPGQDCWSSASGGTATMNTSMSFTLPPFQVELNSMRVKSRLTVPCGSSSYW